MSAEKIVKSLSQQVNALVANKINHIEEADLSFLLAGAKAAVGQFYQYAESDPIELNLRTALLVIGFNYIREKLTSFEALCVAKLGDMKGLTLAIIYALRDRGVISEEEEASLLGEQIQFDRWEGMPSY